MTSAVLISYGYFEKDEIQRGNFEFFIKAGTQLPSSGLQRMHWSLVISSEDCSPCSQLAIPESAFQDGPTDIGVQRVAEHGHFTLIYRTENAGMDIASHNVTFEYFRAKGRLWQYKYFLVINSSAKGPFIPSYMPPGWHWVHAFLVRFRNDVHAVGSSLVCLPEFDAGGPGPRLESWALAVDQQGLQGLIDAGALHVRRCKICKDSSGIIVAGEYGIGKVMIGLGYNMATLMSKYAEDTDWREPSNWKCNDNVHPSRHGTYDGIGFHPYETVFVKSSWHVADPYTSRYSAWKEAHLAGLPGTQGRFDYTKYRYAISGAAQQPNSLEEAYNVTGNMLTWRGTPEYHYF